MADLAGAESPDVREQRYLHYLHRLFVLGVVSAIAMSLGALLLPLVLGGQWETVAPTVIVLAIAVPWRMAFGQAGALAVAARHAAFVVRWELVQLVCFAAAFTAAAAFGYSVFVTTSALAWIASVTLFERKAAKVAGIAGWTWLPRLAAAGVVITIVAGIGLRP